MKCPRIGRGFRIFAMAAGFATVYGCAVSPASRFYVLSPLASAAPNASHARRQNEPLIVAVGPLTIPDAVNRPEIVTADGSQIITIHDFERWAGPLDKNLSRVLIQDLDEKLPSGQFTVIRWDPSSRVNVEPARRVMVDVTRFDLSRGPKGSAAFGADWVLYGPHDKVLAMRQSRCEALVSGSGIRSLSAAMSQCATNFSGELAQAISSSID